MNFSRSLQSPHALGLILFLLTAATAASAEPVSLENNLLRIVWHPQDGRLVSLRDKSTGREWLDPKAPAPAYRILLSGVREPLSPATATSVRVRRLGEAVVIESVHAKPIALTVTCRFLLEEGSAQAMGRIAVRADAPCRIAEVRFPVATLRLPFGRDGGDDRILWPECDGTLLSDPSTHSPNRQFRYPGAASLQMMAALDDEAGLCFAARDSQAHTKAFGTQRRGQGVEFSLGHLLPQLPVKDWELPYDVAIAGLQVQAGMGKLTWEAAADIYRTWAVKQPWCRQTTAQRVATGDIPQWIAEPRLFLTFSLRGQLPDGSSGNRAPLVQDQVERWSRLVDAPVTSLLMSWEKKGSWVTPDYFPPFGGEREFAALNRELRAAGHRSMVFLSGLHWTLQKKKGFAGLAEDLDQEPEFNLHGKSSAIADAKGVPNIGRTPDSDIGRAATICPTTALAHEILAGTAQRCQQLGVGCVQVDQIVGGGMPECHHPEHDHPPGGGTWSSQALYKLFSTIRTAGKARDPDFVFSIEEPGEFYLPILDTYHARDLHQGRWPRSGAGVVGVPLFTHVYHDYLAGYGSEGCYLSEKPSPLAMFQLGSNLVSGKIPAVALWSRWVEPEKVDAAQARLLKAHLGLWRGAARDFLSYGQREATPVLEVPTIEMTFREKDGTARPQAVPAVLHSRWRLPDGRSATLFACIANRPVDFVFGRERITLQPGEATLR